MIPKRSGSSNTGCNARALLRCNHIGCPSETIHPYRPIVFCASIRPSFAQKAHHPFKIFTKNQAYLSTAAPWDGCLVKRDVSRFFSNQSTALRNSTNEFFPLNHYWFILCRHGVSTRPRTSSSRKRTFGKKRSFLMTKERLFLLFFPPNKRRGT